MHGKLHTQFGRGTIHSALGMPWDQEESFKSPQPLMRTEQNFRSVYAPTMISYLKCCCLLPLLIVLWCSSVPNNKQRLWECARLDPSDVYSM